MKPLPISEKKAENLGRIAIAICCASLGIVLFVSYPPFPSKVGLLSLIRGCTPFKEVREEANH